MARQGNGSTGVASGLLGLLAIGLAGNASTATAIAQARPGDQAYRIFVTNEGSGDLSVIDGQSRTVLASWPLGKRPRGIAPSPDGRLLYVALSGSPVAGPGVDEHSLQPSDKSADGIGVVRARDGKLLRVLRGVSDPEQIAVSRDAARLYVASEDSGKAIILDAESVRVLAEIEVGEEPEGVAVTPDGRQIWVTSEVRNAISVIDAKTHQVMGRISVGERPREVAFAPDGSRAYATGEADGSLVAIDVGARKVEKWIKVPGDHSRPKGVLVSRDGKRVYVTTGRAGTLVALDAETLNVVGSVTVGTRPWGIGLSPDGRVAYTANGPSNTVTMVDTETMNVVIKIDVGVRPWGIAVVPE